jgi:hypothetical protein
VLREELIDQYTAILMGCESSQCLDRCTPFLAGIYDFLEATATIEGATNIKIIKNIVALIGDLANYFKGNPNAAAGVKAKSTLPYVEQLIVLLRQQPEAEVRDQANYTLQNINALI